MPIDHSRNENLTDFGKATLTDRYLLPGEDYQDLFYRVASAYATDDGHRDRLYDYMSNLWFMPATPVLSNGGTTRGLPISCFLSESDDDMGGIISNWVENAWLACRGGGIGTYWGNIRSIGETIGAVGKTSGVIPFIKVQDSITLAISQGSLRRGSAAVYLPIWHPEIEEFIDIRRFTGGDPNRKSQNIHNGVVITDDFMEAVEKDDEFALRSPKDDSVIRYIKARDLWIKLLTARLETGEPYLIFIDEINRERPSHQKELGLDVKMSNLCTEITLPTGIDHSGHNRTAVCCLSSLNLETYDQWKDNQEFINDVMMFLDNILDDFIETAPDTHSRAKYSAMRERSVGLGVMGLHYYYQSQGIAWGSSAAYEINKQIFANIANKVNVADMELALERGPCPDAEDAGVKTKRFSNKTSIAPTASISIICGGTSAGIEPLLANTYNHKTLSGSFLVQNRYLKKVLQECGQDNEDVWSSIKLNEGSVQHLEFLSDEHKAIFRTAFEIDQMDIIRQAADRQPFIDQAQSVNLFLPADINKRLLHMLHFKAWELRLKTLYYCRSRSVRRAEKASERVERVVIPELQKIAEPVKIPDNVANLTENYEVCEACQ